MKTQIRTLGDKTLVEFEGRLNFESSDNFRIWLQKFARTIASRQVVFDLGSLQFVGSSGITQFIDSLREFNQNSSVKPLYSNVGIEFRKMIQAYDKTSSFQFWDTKGAGGFLDN